MEYIIALDLSLSSTGVSIFNQDGRIQKIITIETDSKSETQFRLKKLGKELLKIKKEFSPIKIIIESGFTRFNISTQMLFRCHGVAQYIFSDIEQIYYYPMTIRKIVCGKGNVDKKTLQNFILNKYKNVKFKNMDESDSFGIGLAYFMDKGILK